MRSKPFLFSLSFVLLLFTGCASLKSLTAGPRLGKSPKPQVDVTAVTMEIFSKRSVGGQLEMTVANPGADVLTLRYVEWELAVGGEAVTGRTDLPGGLSLPAAGTTPVSAALEVLAVDAERVVPQLDEGLRDYQLRGVLHYDGAAGRKTIAFESAGTL